MMLGSHDPARSWGCLENCKEADHLLTEVIRHLRLLTWFLGEIWCRFLVQTSPFSVGKDHWDICWASEAGESLLLSNARAMTVEYSGVHGKDYEWCEPSIHSQYGWRLPFVMECPNLQLHYTVVATTSVMPSIVPSLGVVRAECSVAGFESSPHTLHQPPR